MGMVALGLTSEPMCQHEKKYCTRCGTSFECKAGNITQCQCYGFAVSDELRAYLEQRYADCVCRKCLDYLSIGLNFFKEKYTFR
jgi:hypothetical protein